MEAIVVTFALLEDTVIQVLIKDLRTHLQVYLTQKHIKATFKVSLQNYLMGIP